MHSEGHVVEFCTWGGRFLRESLWRTRLRGGLLALWWVRGRLVRPELAFLQALRVLGRIKASLHSVSRSTLRRLLRSGPLAARFAVPRGPQNRGALSAKEHAVTGQTVTVFSRHVSQAYRQCDSIDYPYWPASSWRPSSSPQLAPRCTLRFRRLPLRRTSLSRLRPCLGGAEF